MKQSENGRNITKVKKIPHQVSTDGDVSLLQMLVDMPGWKMKGRYFGDNSISCFTLSEDTEGVNLCSFVYFC